MPVPARLVAIVAVFPLTFLVPVVLFSPLLVSNAVIFPPNALALAHEAILRLVSTVPKWRQDILVLVVLVVPIHVWTPPRLVSVEYHRVVFQEHILDEMLA